MLRSTQSRVGAGSVLGAILDRTVREEIAQGTEGGNQVRIWETAKEMGAGSWWSRVIVAGISWGCREETGPREGSGRAIAQSWVAAADTGSRRVLLHTDLAGHRAKLIFPLLRQRWQ